MLTGWSGLAGNQRIDPTAVFGFRLEFTIGTLNRLFLGFAFEFTVGKSRDWYIIFSVTIKLHNIHTHCGLKL